MSSSNNYLVACNFHIMYMFISPSSLHMCLIRFHRSPWELWLPSLVIPPPLLMQLETVVTRCFSSSIPNPWSSHQQLAIIKSAGHHSRQTCLCQIHQICPAFPHPDREHRKDVYFLKFFYNPTDNTLLCSTVKLRKLKCTR